MITLKESLIKTGVISLPKIMSFNPIKDHNLPIGQEVVCIFKKDDHMGYCIYTRETIDEIVPEEIEGWQIFERVEFKKSEQFSTDKYTAIEWTGIAIEELFT